ncbi:MAG TPA: helix-turn-helix domain-containing protein, partial [Chloroflexia bacterium]|nr:helix-turn-helix domain-containing protein [Chloroflexia bacterium]
MAEGPFTMLQVIFKPHGLNTLLGLKASELTNSSLQLNQLVGLDLYSRLLEVNEAEKSIRLLAGFLTAQQKRVKFRDKLVEESLNLIRRNIATVSVRSLLQELGLSERQFEKRFTHSVGLTPQFYIRIKRFNEAVRLLKTGRSESLTSVAQSLNFYDQSHFIRDIREFAGVTPKRIAAKLDDFHHPQAGYSYL